MSDIQADNPDDVQSEGRSLRIGQLRRILALLKPYPGRVALAVLTLLIASALALALPQIASFAVDEVFTLMADTSLGKAAAAEAARTLLNQVVLAAVALLAVQALFVWVRHYLWSWLGERVVVRLRKQVFRSLLGLSPAWFQERRSGELVSRFSGDVAIIEGVVGSDLSIALRQTVTLIGCVVLLLIQSPMLTLAILAVIPPLILGMVAFGRVIRKISKDVQDKLADAGAQLDESVGAMDTIQAFTRERYEEGRYSDKVETAFGAARRLFVWRSTFMSTIGFFSMAPIIFILYIGTIAVIGETMTSGDLLAFLMYSAGVAASVGSLSGVWGNLMRAIGATERLYEIIDTVPDIADPIEPKVLPEGGGAVVFESVDFVYPSRPEAQVLQDVSVELEPGAVVAAVGSSGSGKTTMAKLLQRFYDPTAGRITLEGVDIRDLALEDLRGRQAVVSQEPVLFSGSISDNIAYGRDDVSQEAIEAAARDAHAHDFIAAFPEGYNTAVGERGVKLSGGQRQRIAIARAILADPRILILDEATSSLDSESEALVQEALNRLMVGRTTFVIAHRLSTIQNADRILVLDHGRVVESGSHDSLMNGEGIYRKLVDHQVIAQAG